MNSFKTRLNLEPLDGRVMPSAAMPADNSQTALASDSATKTEGDYSVTATTTATTSLALAVRRRRVI